MTKTGPKPLSGAEYFQQNQHRWQNSKLVSALSDRKWLVQCLSCGSQRESTGYRYGKCECAYSRSTYIKDAPDVERRCGHTDYKCVSVGNRSSGKKHEFVHETCGTKFEAGLDTMRGSKVPCPKCRSLFKTHEQFLMDLDRVGSLLVPVEKYQSSSTQLQFKHPCGCVHRWTPSLIIRGSDPYCPSCNPNAAWWPQVVNGVEFKFKSKVEYRFLKCLLRSGYSLSEIEYEPKAIVIYTHPSGKRRRYRPDFRVGNIYIEVKSSASAGLRGSYRGKLGEDVLAENRAKFKAAKAQLPEFRVFVETGKKFLSWKSANRKLRS